MGLIKKGIKIEQAFHTICKSLSYFPSVHVSFIWGFPFEDTESVRETMRWVDIFEKAGATVLLFELAPLPGSEIYKTNRNNLVFDENKYSFFVVTGHEKVLADRYIHSKDSKTLVDMIRKYPAIFPGFYRYCSSLELELSNVFENYKLKRRTKVINEFDV